MGKAYSAHAIIKTRISTPWDVKSVSVLLGPHTHACVHTHCNICIYLFHTLLPVNIAFLPTVDFSSHIKQVLHISNPPPGSQDGCVFGVLWWQEWTNRSGCCSEPSTAISNYTHETSTSLYCVYLHVHVLNFFLAGRQRTSRSPSGE